MTHPATTALESLKTGDAKTKLAAAGKVALLAQNGGKQPALDETIPVLISLARNGDEAELQAEAIRALEVLADTRAERKSIILSAGGLAAVVAQLREPTERTVKSVAAATKALWKFALNDSSIQLAAVQAGAVPKVVKLLTDKATQRWAVACLHCLTSHCAEAREAALAVSCQDVLTDVKITGNCMEVRDWAQDTLDNLYPLSDGKFHTTPRYSAMGALGAVKDHRGKQLYAL